MRDTVQRAIEKRDALLTQYRKEIDNLERLVSERRILCLDCWHELNECGGGDFPHRGQRVAMPDALNSLGLGEGRER